MSIRALVPAALVLCGAAASASASLHGMGAFTTGSPPDGITPTPNPMGGYTWANPPWSRNVDGPDIANYRINPGQSFAFGSDNTPDDTLTKIVTLTFFFDDGLGSPRPPLGIESVSSVGAGVAGAASITDGGRQFSQAFTFTPCPAWEYFIISNTSNAGQTRVTNINITWVKVPAPGTTALAGVAALVSGRRRRR